MPRVAFWLMWTAWLWYLQWFPLARGPVALVIIVGPPVLVAWIGSRIAKNPLESPNAVFWKGAALSCLLGAFASILLLKEIGFGSNILVGLGLICGYLGLRGPGLKKVALTQGELFDRAQFIARRCGVPVKRLVVFASPQDLPAAFAQRGTEAIMLSDRLLRLLSRRETEAVMAHEAAHFRPLQKAMVSGAPMIAVFAILVGSFWPEGRLFTPFVPILSLLAWRALRRMQEYDADSNAVRATGNPEGLITALTRISGASGMPLHWGPAAGLFLPHPPMTARFRSIARKAGIGAARLEEIVSDARTIPTLPGFPSPFDNSQPADDGLLSSHRGRLSKRMMLLSKVFPIVAGVAFAAEERVLMTDALTSIAHFAAWCVAAMLVFWVAYEIIAGSERRRLREQLPEAHREGSFFAGFSTGAEPRYYEGLYHYDLGMVRIEGGSLSFAGTRCSFSIRSSEARRVWLGSGARHWTPRKTVCIEYELDGGTTGLVSLQSLERWFWPGTSTAAQELFSGVTRWSKKEELPGAHGSPPPQVTGALVPRVKLAGVWKSMRVPCLVSLALGWFFVQLPTPEGILAPFAAPLVTGALILFIFAPHLDSGQAGSVQRSPVESPGCPEARR